MIFNLYNAEYLIQLYVHHNEEILVQEVTVFIRLDTAIILITGRLFYFPV